MEEIAGGGEIGVSEAERGFINRDQYCFARFPPLITNDKAALDEKSLMRAPSTRNKLELRERRRHCLT